MTPIDWALHPLRHYADFNGRAPRAEYWWYTLATAIIGLGLDYLDRLVGGSVIGVYGPLSLIFTLGLLVPGIAVAVRRLHDINRTGWWILLDLWSYVFVIAGFGKISLESAIKGLSPAPALILIITVLLGAVIMLVFMVTRGSDGPNRYGPDPYGPNQLEQVFA